MPTLATIRTLFAPEDRRISQRNLLLTNSYVFPPCNTLNDISEVATGNLHPTRSCRAAARRIATQCLEQPGTARSAGKIPKPPGEVTRLSRNGYSLLQALDWERKLYKQVMDFVKERAKARLRIDLSFKAQDQSKVHLVCAEVARKFNILDAYESHWPTRDMLIIYLKNSSAHIRSLRRH